MDTRAGTQTQKIIGATFPSCIEVGVLWNPIQEWVLYGTMLSLAQLHAVGHLGNHGYLIMEDWAFPTKIDMSTSMQKLYDQISN